MMAMLGAVNSADANPAAMNTALIRIISSSPSPLTAARDRTEKTARTRPRVTAATYGPHRISW